MQWIDLETITYRYLEEKNMRLRKTRHFLVHKAATNISLQYVSPRWCFDFGA